MMAPFLEDDWFPELRIVESRVGGGEGSDRGASTAVRGSMAVDLIEREHDYVLHADLPGVKQEDIDISVDRDVLTVKASRKHEYRSEDVKGGRRFERSWGNYSRSIRLPHDADQGNPSAAYENGVLTINFKKVAPEVQVKKIAIGGTNNTNTSS